MLKSMQVCISKANKFEYNGVVIYDSSITESKSTLHYLLMLKSFL